MLQFDLPVLEYLNANFHRGTNPSLIEFQSLAIFLYEDFSESELRFE